MVEPLAHCRERARASPVRDAPLPPARCASQVAGHRARKGKVDAGDGAGHDTIRSILGHRTPSTRPTGRRRSWPLPAMTVAPAGATRRSGGVLAQRQHPSANGSCSADGHRATLNPARLVTGVPQVSSLASLASTGRSGRSASRTTAACSPTRYPHSERHHWKRREMVVAPWPTFPPPLASKRTVGTALTCQQRGAGPSGN